MRGKTEKRRKGKGEVIKRDGEGRKGKGRKGERRK